MIETASRKTDAWNAVYVRACSACSKQRCSSSGLSAVTCCHRSARSGSGLDPVEHQGGATSIRTWHASSVDYAQRYMATIEIGFRYDIQLDDSSRLISRTKTESCRSSGGQSTDFRSYICNDRNHVRMQPNTKINHENERQFRPESVPQAELWVTRQEGSQKGSVANRRPGSWHFSNRTAPDFSPLLSPLQFSQHLKHLPTPQSTSVRCVLSPLPPFSPLLASLPLRTSAA